MTGKLSSSASSRVTELDATRGVAMLGVCVSHLADLVTGRSSTAIGDLLVSLGLMATPTFLLLSGIICGHLATSRPARHAELRWRWLDRGVFLLLVSHFVIGTINAIWMPLRSAWFANVYMTDAVGICLLCASVGLANLTLRNLLLAGSGLVVGSLLAAEWLATTHGVVHELSRLLVGQSYRSTLTDLHMRDSYMVPLLPYVGIFMLGLAAGKGYTRLRVRGISNQHIGRYTMMVGGACVVLAVGMKLIATHIYPHSTLLQNTLHDLCALRQKLPPGPAYLLLFGGVGLVVLGALSAASATQLGRILIARFATVGQASLFVFMLQYLFYYLPGRGFGAIHLQGAALVIYFLWSLFMLWWAAWLWGHVNGNRWLTVGIQSLSKPQHSGVTG